MVDERLIAVGAPLGDVHHAAILCGKLHPDPLLVGRRFAPQVEDDVEQRAHRAAHELRLRPRGELIVQPPEATLAVYEPGVDLRHAAVQPVRLQFPLAPHPCKEAAVILAPLGLDDVDARELGFPEHHLRDRLPYWSTNRALPVPPAPGKSGASRASAGTDPERPGCCALASVRLTLWPPPIFRGAARGHCRF